jgi:hypothetical protein
MIENFRSGMLWRLTQRCPYLVRGLRRAGFTGGWLEQTGPGLPPRTIGWGPPEIDRALAPGGGWHNYEAEEVCR